MGKGDRKSKRGKIWRGTTGKRRPGSQKLRKLKKERAVVATSNKS
jgi:30S ribosomal protein S31